MAKDIKRHIQHLKNGTGAKPTSGASTELLFGEIAVGYKAGEEALYILDSNSGITEFNPTTTVLALAENYTDTKIGALDAAITGSAGAGKTLTAFSQTDGKVTATFGNISITKSQVSDFPTIGNGTFTISGNGTSVASTSANATNNTGLNIKAGSNITITTGASEITIAGKAGTVTKISTASGITGGDITTSGTIGLAATGTAGTYGPSANVTGTEGTTIKVPQITTDAYGRVTAVTERTLTNKNTTYTAATAAPNNVATASSVGTSAKYAREDHTHAISLATGTGAGQVKIAGKDVSVNGFLPYETGLTSTSDTNIPTSKAVADYVTQQMASALTYKGSISSNDTLKNAHKVGDVYVVSSAGTYAGKACEVGDYLIANTARESASTVTNADWDAINGENQVENKSASLAAAGSSATIATVDGTNITITTPSTWTGVGKVGTVTKVSTGAGLVGGDITTTGTLKAALSSETRSTLAATAMGSTDNRQYAVGLDKNGVLSVNIPWTNTNSGYVPTGRTITTTSGLTGGGNLSANRTIGLEATGTSGTYGPTADVTGTEGTTIKIPQITTDAYGRVTSVTERTLTNKNSTYTVNNGIFAISGNGTSVASTSANASANSGLNIKNSTFVSLTTGTSELTIGVSTGTTSATLARGDHSHSSYVNQNAFSNIKVGSTTVAADTATDTVEFAVDSNGAISITGDATNDKVTFGLGNIVCGDYA